MRTLRFIVDNETIKPDPSCNFTGLFPGRNPNVKAEFVFSDEWKNTAKVAAFWSVLDSEYEPQALSNDCCKIPSEALSKTSFKIQVIGKKTKPSFDRTAITTNKLTIRQTGGTR